MPNYTKPLQKARMQVTRFPSGQPFMKIGPRKPVIGRFDKNDLGHDYVSWLRSEGWMPLQGPDLPLDAYLNWKAMKREDNPIYRRWAYDDYRNALEADRARQRYNQKVSAWNEYLDMSPDERAYWANKEAVWDDIRMQEPRMSKKRLAEYMAMDEQGPHQWARDYARRRYPDEYTGVEYYDYENMPEIEFIEDFPEGLVNAPWRR